MFKVQTSLVRDRKLLLIINYLKTRFHLFTFKNTLNIILRWKIKKFPLLYYLYFINFALILGLKTFWNFEPERNFS